MVVKTMQEDIFKTDAKHIAFAINKEGINDLGFAGQVSCKYWEELANCGEHEIGTVLSKTVKWMPDNIDEIAKNITDSLVNYFQL